MQQSMQAKELSMCCHVWLSATTTKLTARTTTHLNQSRKPIKTFLMTLQGSLPPSPPAPQTPTWHMPRATREQHARCAPRVCGLRAPRQAAHPTQSNPTDATPIDHNLTDIYYAYIHISNETNANCCHSATSTRKKAVDCFYARSRHLLSCVVCPCCGPPRKCSLIRRQCRQRNNSSTSVRVCVCCVCVY